MNTVVSMPSPPVAAIAPAALVPANMGEAIKLAELMATAKLVPEALQQSPADCLMVIQQAVRWQMDPFAVAQECSVIHGKLMHSGKLTLAVINARGNLRDRLKFDYSGAGNDRTITVTGTLQGETSPRSVAVRLQDARTSNKVWQSQPDQQLAYHGARVWARRHTPELMLGVYSPEEFDETNGPQPSMRDVSPAKPKPPRPPSPNAPPHDPITGEISGPHLVEVPENAGNKAVAWGEAYAIAIESASSTAEIAQWEQFNARLYDQLKRFEPDAHKTVTERIRKKKLALATADKSISTGKPAGEQQPTPDRPEEFRKHVETALAVATTMDELNAAWNRIVQPHWDDIFPPDQTDLSDLFGRHQRRIEPEE